MSETAIGRRCIETYSGRFIDPLDPSPAALSLDDIAHALANICRFQGHTRRHYSVAEHSLYVADLLSLWGHGSPTILAGLMHDASEAYIADLTSPLKDDPFGMAFRGAEHRLMECIASRFDFGWPLAKPVKEADHVLLWCEADVLLPSCGTTWGEYDSFGRQCIADHRDICDWIRKGEYMPSLRIDTAGVFLDYVRNFGMRA